MISDKRNSLWLSLRYIFLLLFALLNYKINITQFGEDLFGAWILIVTIWSFGNAIDLGMGTAIIKFTAEYSNNKKEDLKFYLSSSFYVFILLGIIISIIVYFLGIIFFIKDNELLKTIDYISIQKAYLILAFSFIIRYISIFFRSVFEGISEFVMTSKIEIFSSFLTFLFVLLTYILKMSISYLAFFYLCVSFITFTIYLYVYIRKFTLQSLGKKLFSINFVKKIFNFSIHIQIFNLIFGLIDPIIKFLTGNHLGLKSVTFYEIGRRVATSISGLFFSAFRIVLPKASVLKDLNDKRKFLLDDAVKYMKFGVFYAILFFGVGAFFISLFIKFFYGEVEYIYVFLILAAAESLTIFGSTIYAFIMGIGKGKFLTILQVMNVVLVTISVFLGLYLLKDMIGLLGYFISVVFGNILLLYYIKLNFFITIRKFLNNIKILRLFLFLISFLISIFLIYYFKININLVLGINSILMFMLVIKDIKSFYSSMIQPFLLKIGIRWVH
ncbi:MAG: oligosaccharide flippase family protein [Candidatus Lokiarchaeota archaeon]|nr:oligosaccharide flippase family protein [Candidatus Lokiarchaeota archaeon]